MKILLKLLHSTVAFVRSSIHKCYMDGGHTRVMLDALLLIAYTFKRAGIVQKLLSL